MNRVMAWEINKDRPVFTQLVERIQSDIFKGVYLPGQRLSSVRELALQAGVNPNTMQKALMQLEGMGLIYSKRTAGRFISEEISAAEELKEVRIKEITEQYLSQMREFSLTANDVIQIIKNTSNERCD